MERTVRISDKAGVGCMILFGIPFFLAGAGILIYALWGFWEWHKIQSWAPAEARILETNLEVHRGDDSTTYKVTAQYAYTFKGRDYTGSRVGIQDTADNIGSFHEDAYRELSAARDRGAPVTCYVNAQEPTESVLYRDLRVGLQALAGGGGLLFALVGGGIIVAALYGGRAVKRKAALQASQPGQPWLWRDDWRSGVVRSSNKGEMIGAFIFAVLWNGISSPVLVFFPEAWNDSGPVALLMLLFPAVGAGLAFWAARSVVRWRKFGESAFYMASVPGVAGGYLEGMIRIPRPIRPDADFRLTLRCLKRVTSGSGKNKTTTDHVVWEHEYALPPEQMLHDAMQCAVPVRFAIPYDAPQTDPETVPPILWKLDAAAPLPGVDFSTTFEVPVFRTEASKPEFDPARDAPAVTGREFTVEERLTAAGIETQPLAGGGMRFRFPRAQHVAPLLIALIMFVVFAGVGGGLFFTGAAPVFGVVFGLVGIIMGLLFLDQAFGYIEVEVEAHAIRIRGGSMGLGGLTRVDPATITEIEYKESMTMNGQPYFNVLVKCGEGKPVRISRHIRGADNAEAYVQALWRAMGQGGKTA